VSSLSFGELPSYEEFEEVFEQACPDGFMPLSLNDRDAEVLEWSRAELNPAGPWTVDEAYEAIEHLTELWESGNVYVGDAAGELANSLLETLGFEWV